MYPIETIWNALLSPGRAMRRWYLEQAAIGELSRLPRHALRDIGVGPGDIASVAKGLLDPPAAVERPRDEDNLSTIRRKLYPAGNVKKLDLAA